MIISPCKDCKERFEACHSKCDKYKDWKQEVDVIKAQITKEKYLQHELLDVKKEAITRMQSKRTYKK